MSFLLIGNQVINLMMVSRCQYEEAFDLEPSELLLAMAGEDETQHFTGEDADSLWNALRNMATPLDRFSPLNTPK